MSVSQRILSAYKRLKECDMNGADACMGDAAGVMNDAGVSNSSKYGTNVHRGLGKEKSKAVKILRGLQIVEAEQADPNDDKVVAKVEQDVTVGDLKNASKAAKLLADAGKLDKNTADKIQQDLDNIQ